MDAKARARIELDTEKLLGVGAGQGVMVGVPKPDSDSPPDDDASGLQREITALLSRPDDAEALLDLLAERVRTALPDGVDVVVSLAVGGVVVGHGLGVRLGLPVACLERDGDRFALRTGCTIPAGSRCLVADDTVMRGNALAAARAAVEREGGQVVGSTCLVRELREDWDPRPAPVSLAGDVDELRNRLETRGAA